MKINPRRGKTAFTLIELMAVITIIVILAGLVVGGMGFVTERQAKEKAKVQIALLSKAIEEYKLDMGTYPPTGNSVDGSGQSVDSLYTSLFYEGYDYEKQTTPPATWTKKIGTVDFPKATKIYLTDLDPTRNKQGWMSSSFAGQATPPLPTKTGKNSTTIVDPWGKEYGYRTGTDAGGTANIDTQNPDFDLWSWGKDSKTRTGTPSDPTNRDDIKNF